MNQLVDDRYQLDTYCRLTLGSERDDKYLFFLIKHTKQYWNNFFILDFSLVFNSDWPKSIWALNK